MKQIEVISAKTKKTIYLIYKLLKFIKRKVLIPLYRALF